MNKEVKTGGPDDKLVNPCVFMTLPKCMRQDTERQLNFDICQACIAARTEGHIFALREELHKFVSIVGSRR